MSALAEWAMLSSGWRRWLLLVAAGAMAGLSAPPLFFLPGLLLALPIWIWCLDGAEQGRGVGLVFGPAFRIGFAFGLGYFTVSFHWLGMAFLFEGGAVVLAMPFAIAALAALIAFFWGLASALSHRLWSDGPWRILGFAASLTAAEWVRGHLFSGFPFDLLGYSLTANDEMMQLASVIGVYGLSFLVVLLGASLALPWPADRRTLPRRLLAPLLVVLVIAGQLGFGAFRLETTPLEAEGPGRMRLVQPVIYEHVRFGEIDPAGVIDKLLALTETQTGPADAGLSGIDQVVWPESSLPFFLSSYPEALARIARALPPHTMLLSGAPREEHLPGEGPGDRPAFNALLVIDTEGEIVASYDKSHLVPFGEYLPFPEAFAAIGLRQFVPGANGWQPGDGRRLLRPEGSLPFLALICYEVIFSGDLGDVGNAAFLLNITNDAWFDGSIGPAKHAHHARLRAVEEGVSLVRAANSGLTFATDPLGRITSALPPLVPGVLDLSPVPKLAGTPFAQLRHFPLLLVEVLAFALAFGATRRSRAGG